MERQTLSRSIMIGRGTKAMGFSSGGVGGGGEIGLDSECGMGTWAFIAKEQDGSRWVENY